MYSYERIIINVRPLRFRIESNVDKNILLVFDAHGNSEHWYYYVDEASDCMEDLNILNKYENWYDPCTETETDLFRFGGNVHWKWNWRLKTI